VKNLLSFSKSEKRNLKIGLLVLIAVLFLANIRPLYEGVSQLSVWQKKPRPAELSPNFQPPPYYEGELNDLGTVRFVTLDVLILVYQKIGDFELSPTEINDIREVIKLSREFFWRNSNLQLNLNPTFLEVDENMPAELLDEQGKIWLKSGRVEEDLLQRGVGKNQYDCVFLLYPYSPAVSGSGMELKRLGKPSYSFASLPTEDLDWIFARELWYSINTVVYKHDSEKIEDWGALAGTLRQFSIQDPPKPYGRIYLTLDFDRDGVPDDEPMVPLYEVELRSNRETRDTDDDGLEDKKEITAGIFQGTDPTLPDTDGDGLLDGEDPEPLQK
jgi:hypothetical protein